MSQFYARIFVQILDSSIAEDFTTRHVFEDFLKLCDRNGIVDMTRHALSRRLNVPLDILNACITKLEAPDPSSRDPESEGRRLIPLDQHRDWGWQITNYEKYDAMKTKADGAARVARHRKSAEGFDADEAITDATEDPAVIEAWLSWVKHRKEKRASITPETAKKQIAQLAEWGPQRFIAAINHSITKGWTGLFESKDGAPAKPLAPFPPSLAAQVKATQDLLASTERKINAIAIPAPSVFPTDFHKAMAQRAPLLEEKKRLKARLTDLQQQTAQTT